VALELVAFAGSHLVSIAVPIVTSTGWSDVSKLSRAPVATTAQRDDATINTKLQILA
jgi:hypothetical protein